MVDGAQWTVHTFVVGNAQCAMNTDKGLTSSFFSPSSYVPRKCSATNRIIKAKDHASVQISIAKVDENGRQIPGENHVYALSGFVRAMAESDDAMNRLAQRDGLLKNVWSAQR